MDVQRPDPSGELQQRGRLVADVSEDIAREIQQRHHVIGESLPAHIQGFVEMHSGPVWQLGAEADLANPRVTAGTRAHTVLPAGEDA